MITTTSGNAVSATTATNATNATNVSGSGTVAASTIFAASQISVTGNGASNDPYGTMAVTEPPGAPNYSYYGLTRAGQMGAGFGLTGSNGALGLGQNAFWFGSASAGATGVMTGAWAAFTSTALVTAGTISDSTAILRPLVSGAAQATNTGATSYQFTGIPSWVKKITVMLSGVTRSGTTVTVIQIGSTTFTTSGYLGSSWPAAGGAVGNSSGFGWAGNLAASDTTYGVMTITNISGNTWVAGVCGAVNQVNLAIGGGNVTLAGVLDRVRVSSLPGTSTFSAGSINVFWE
jgi:hypothetical protein